MPPRTFLYETTVRLHDTDAAGVLFFGHLFRHLHDAYESFMASLGYPLPALIAPADDRQPLPLPIVHAQADYLRPVRHGERLRLCLTVAEVRTRSFALEYVLEDTAGTVRARGRTVHVAAVEARLPEGLRQALRGQTDPEPGRAS